MEEKIIGVLSPLIRILNTCQNIFKAGGTELYDPQKKRGEIILQSGLVYNSESTSLLVCVRTQELTFYFSNIFQLHGIFKRNFTNESTEINTQSSFFHCTLTHDQK